MTVYAGYCACSLFFSFFCSNCIETKLTHERWTDDWSIKMCRTKEKKKKDGESVFASHIRNTYYSGIWVEPGVFSKITCVFNDGLLLPKILCVLFMHNFIFVGVQVEQLIKFLCTLEAFTLYSSDIFNVIPLKRKSETILH